MNDFDTTHRFVFDNSDIRGEIVTLHESFRKAVEHQSLTPQQKRLLGEFFVAVTLMSETLKFDGLLTLQARGDGIIPLVMAETTHNGHVRGIIKTSGEFAQRKNAGDDLEIDTSNLKQVIGNGVLTLTMDPRKGERYQGIVPLEGNTLADCLSRYFMQSEQLPTRFWIFSDSETAGGLLLQGLPAQKVLDYETRQNQWQTAVQLASTVTSRELFELDHSTVLFRLFNEMDCRLFAGRNIIFQCSCTRDRSANAIASLGKHEAFELLSEREIIHADCQFCGQIYRFNEADVIALFGEKDLPLH